MNLRLYFLKAAAVTSAFVLVAGMATVSAQGIPATVSGLDLTPSTLNPSPGQTVTIVAKSYSVDINSATVTWTAAGKTLDKGIGLNTITVKAPPIGKVINVSVTAVTPDGTTFRNSIQINSGAVDMIVEPQGYVPPMWSGKISPSYQNDVKIVAVPHLANSAGVEADPKTLVYTWQQSGSALESQSGYGRQSISIPGAMIPRPYIMTVTASTRDGSMQTTGLVAVNLNQAFIGFYKNDPLYGPLYNKSVSDSLYLGSQRETSVLAVPYGFNISGAGLGDLDLTWLINGIEHPELASNKTVTLRAPDASAGSSNVELDIKNTKSIMQGASASFGVVFSAATDKPTTTF